MKRKEVVKMKKEKIYVIYDYFYKIEDTAIDSLAFKDKEKALKLAMTLNNKYLEMAELK